MNGGLRAFLFSFQTKLVLALTAVILLAIFVAGAVFVVRSRHDRREQALERVAAASPALYQQALADYSSQEVGRAPFGDYQALDELAKDEDARALMVGPDGVIFHDTEDRLTGAALDVPESTVTDVQRGFVAWEPPANFAEKDVTLVAASSRFTFGPGRTIPFRIVLAVRSDTVAQAWRGVLPSLLLAALVGVPISVLVGVGLARQVAQPVQRLTEASEAMAHGDFDQRVEVDRDDEMGRLARSFSAMAQRVGERDTQMRALLANVSHDLKTPMTSITGYAQSLGDGTAAPEDSARIGNVIRDEAEHVNRLLADLLYLAEIDAGQLIPRREDVALDPVLARCIRRIEPAARAKDVDVVTDINADVRLHAVDAEKLERAFTNVLDNAAKFAPEGGRISVRTLPNGHVPGHPATTVEIANTGSRIDDADLPRVFERFFRGDRSRRSSGGSGLGLAIAKELVELHGGVISVHNAPDGVAFDIQLPISSNGAT